MQMIRKVEPETVYCWVNYKQIQSLWSGYCLKLGS